MKLKRKSHNPYKGGHRKECEGLGQNMHMAWCNSGMNVMGVTNGSLIGLKACPTKEKSCMILGTSYQGQQNHESLKRTYNCDFTKPAQSLTPF